MTAALWSTKSLPDILHNYLFCEKKAAGTMSKATSAFSTRSLISSPRKGPHIHLSMLSRHLKISKPIWHYLHHRRPLKFASVEWLWQAITPMQDIGNLTRISSDKSGHSKRRHPPSPQPPEGGRGEEGPAGLREKTERVTDPCKHAAGVSKHIAHGRLRFVAQSHDRIKQNINMRITLVNKGRFFIPERLRQKGCTEVRPFLCLVCFCFVFLLSMRTVPECIRPSVSHTMIIQP